jgi:hypothetical protein
MILRMKSKLTAIMIAAIAVAALAGAGAVMAAQGSSPSSSSPRTSTGSSPQQAQDYDAQGVIKQVTFDQGTTRSGNLVFLPRGKQATVTVAFTTATKITLESDGSDEDHSISSQGALKAGMTVEVKGTQQTDGTVQASDIQAGTKDGNDNDDQNGQDDDSNTHSGCHNGEDSSHNGQPTPTSTPCAGSSNSGD